MLNIRPGLVDVAPSSHSPVAPLQPGDLLRLAEQDYRFGIGPIIVEVRQVLGRQVLADGVWRAANVIQTRWDGSTLARHLLIRATAIPAALQPGSPSRT